VSAAGTSPGARAGSIALSLVSHTNAGKTTLARTLLGRDIGEVRDAPHVTEFADAFTLLETPTGETLQLWDTPGFGDSLRLLRRMRQATQPLGWFLSAVWDRWRDKPFWHSQQALRNVRDHSDVVLYLVNAAETPQAAGYLASEMELLAWTGKPVIVLLNQLGAPREAALEDAEVQQWRQHLAPFVAVHAVLPLDAFARCACGSAA
jgi:predicted GTPase